MFSFQMDHEINFLVPHEAYKMSAVLYNNSAHTGLIDRSSALR